MTHLTRALLRFQRGDRRGRARRRRRRRRANRPTRAESLRSYAAIVFRAPSTTGRARAPSRPIPSSTACRSSSAHAVDDIRHVIGVYATRLERARGRASRAAGARGGGRGRLVAARPVPPAAGGPGRAAPRDGRVRARSGGRRRSAGGEPCETIEIDEELATDGAGVPALLAAAHADWAALCGCAGRSAWTASRCRTPSRAPVELRRGDAAVRAADLAHQGPARVGQPDLAFAGRPGVRMAGRRHRRAAATAGRDWPPPSTSPCARCFSGWPARTRCRRSRTTSATRSARRTVRDA